MLFVNLQKVGGVRQVDFRMSCPFSTGTGQGNKKRDLT